MIGRNSFVSLFVLVLIFGCAQKRTNIAAIPDDIACPEIYKFNANYNNLWRATVQALSEEDVVKSIDKSSGIIVTEYGTIDNKENSLFTVYFGAKTYKYSYSVNFLSLVSENTKMKVSVNLMNNQFAILNREQEIPSVENYLRKKLYQKICFYLNPESNQCDAICSADNHSISSYSTPKPTHPLEIVQQQLQQLGYDPGPVDGLMGRKTKDAISRFQKDNALSVTGQADEKTKTTLELLTGETKG